jgi:hypothetical protein
MTPAAQAQFPPQGDDVTQSLGQFRIVVNPAFQPMMAGYPGYVAATARLTSPVLLDQNTLIGRSNPLLDGSAADAGGVAVGIAGTMVSEASLPVQPGGLGPVNTREVHTEVRTMNMTGGGGMAVRAGTLAPAQPISAGEVESWSGASFNPVLDFPAQSFFDVFVDVDLPAGGGFPGAIGPGCLYNSAPLLIQNTNLTSFPPEVVYIHGMSTAVPIMFRTADPGGAWNANDIFGLLILAGHGTFSNDQAKAESDLLTALGTTPEVPVEPPYELWAPGLTVAGANMIFSGKGDDITNSLGVFRLVLNPAFQPLMTGYPGWNPVTKRLDSPLLSDQLTRVGRSAPLLGGSAPDTNGVLVGSANTLVRDSNMTLIPPGFEGPNGTREVHTELRTLNLTGGGAAVRAGTAAPTRPGSFGEVESLSGNSGNPYWDFPAKSFFDVNVEVDMPNLGGQPLVTVTNTKALVVQNNDVRFFTPRVIYVHGNSTAVPVAFKNSNPPLWNGGEILGILMLAGHGINYSSGNASEFQQAMSHATEMQVDPPYATWAPDLSVPFQISGISVQPGGIVQINGYCRPNSMVLLHATSDLGNNSNWPIVSQTQGSPDGTFHLTHQSSGAQQRMFYRAATQY